MSILAVNSKILSKVKRPNEISGLFFNADVSLITAVSDGTLVTTISDLVNGNDLTQSNSGMQFNYRLNQNNGYAALNKEVGQNKGYYSINNNLENSWGSDVTLFYVCYIPTIAAPNGLLTSGIFNYGGGATGGFELYVSSYIQYRELNLLPTFSSPLMAYNAGLNIISVNIKRSGVSYISVNGVRSIMSSNTPAYNQSTFDNIYVSMSPIASAGTPAGFKFCQMLVYSRALIQQEEYQIYRYLKFKWGL